MKRRFLPDLYFDYGRFIELFDTFMYAKNFDGNYVYIAEHSDVKVNAAGFAYFEVGTQRFHCNDKAAGQDFVRYLSQFKHTV